MTRITTITTVLAILVFCSTALSDDLHVPADYNTIQAAIDAAVDGDVVIVADGNYTGPRNKNLDFAGRAITVRSENGPEVTIIDCENDGRGFDFHSAEDSNSVLEGFTITRGSAHDGGAVHCNESSPVIKDCIFTSNSASHNGGGVALLSSSAVVTNCLFRNNRGRIHAGAMSCSESEALVQDCVFLENFTYSYSADGGAMLIAGKPSPTVMNCLFAANQTDRDGGGGGIRNYKSSPTIINCTFANNDSEGGGAICNAPDCSVTMVNCILWGNTAGYYGGHEMLNDDDSHANVSSCDIMGGWNGSRVRNNDTSSVIDAGGNINADPLFVTGPFGDYYLSQVASGQVSDSSCVDAGSDLASALGLDIYTTRTDQLPDTNTVDIGYHYLPPNTNPVACIVGGDRLVEAEGDCEAVVVLDGSCSSDEDSTAGTNDDINDFDWYEVIDACEPNSDIYIGSGEVIECNLGLGEHLIILEVTDKAGAFDSNEVVITVEDVTPPEFSLTVEPNVLWPPNGKMVEVRPQWEASDNCDEEVEVSLVDITMSAAGDINDYVEIGDDGSIYLRARRSKGKGIRVYTLTYQVADDFGNVTEASTTVAVRHRKGPRKLGGGLVRRPGRQLYRRAVPK
ncbi:MAG: hypothetical protein JSV99_07590, partial [Planctomycetota bacterium]